MVYLREILYSNLGEIDESNKEYTGQVTPQNFVVWDFRRQTGNVS
jgi:hypothetical protein